MPLDACDLPMGGSAAAVAAYDRAVESLLRLRPAVVGDVRDALTQDPDCVMARALRAYLGLTSSEAGDVAAAAAAVENVADGSRREAGHLAAIRSWIDGDWRRASRILDDVLDEHPRDALALFVGHQLDFFLGDAANLRDRVQRSLPAWGPVHPFRGFVLGQLAFGLEECGDYAAAERAGVAALAANPDDAWAIHALAHVHEMRGDVAAGQALLDATREGWASDGLLTVHVAWHEALFALERGEAAAVLRLYDTGVRPEEGRGSALALLDATALLWRLWLDGVDVGDRWSGLADAWATALPPEAGGWYVFNDLHAVMALVGAGRRDEAEGMVARLRSFARDGGAGTTGHVMVAAVGLPVAQGLAAFGRGDYAAALAAMAPVAGHLSLIGGSHAQRDVFQRTLLVAAGRAGETGFARRLARSRLRERPSSRWARARLTEFGGPAPDGSERSSTPDPG